MAQKSLTFKKPYIHAAFTKCFTQLSFNLAHLFVPNSSSGELKYVTKDQIQTYICNNGYAEHEKNLCSLLKALKTLILKSCMHVHI